MRNATWNDLDGGRITAEATVEAILSAKDDALPKDL